MPEETQSPGEAAIYLFPFIISSQQGMRARHQVDVGEATLRFYAPFVHSEGDEPDLEQVAWKYVPFPPSTRTPSEPMPEFRTPGIKRNWNEPSVDADAIRVDYYPLDAVDDMGFEVGERLVGLIRQVTEQWWVGRDIRFARTWLRNTTPIDTAGGLASGKKKVGFYATNIGTVGYESLLTPDRFESACRNLAAGEEPLLYRDLVLDAHYFHAIRNTRRSVLAATMACEAAINYRVAQEAESRGVEYNVLGRRIDSSNLEKNMASGCERLFGRSFKEDCPDDYRVLQHMWRKRGTLGHGQRTSIATDEISDGSEEGVRIEIVKRARNFLSWIESV